MPNGCRTIGYKVWVWTVLDHTTNDPRSALMKIAAPYDLNPNLTHPVQARRVSLLSSAMPLPSSMLAVRQPRLMVPGPTDWHTMTMLIVSLTVVASVPEHVVSLGISHVHDIHVWAATQREREREKQRRCSPYNH